MNYKYYVGIDISKNTLDMTVLREKEVVLQVQTGNDLIGIQTFIRQLKQQTKCSRLNEVLFCMEHTGIYNQHLLQFLLRHQASICLETAVQIKLSSGLQRGKNDKIDSVRIAQYAYKNRDGIKLWEPKREVLQKLKHHAALRSRLLNAKKQLTVAYKEIAGFDKKAGLEMRRLSKASIAALESDVAKTEKAMEQLIQADEHLRQLFSIVTSVQGIGKVTATEIIVATNEFKDISDPKKFACYAGVVPFEHQSGSSLRGKARVSHKANKTMKSLLHMSAMTAICYNDDMRKYYERKLEEKKNKMSIINAVRNKLIHRIFACVRNNKKYEKNLSPALV